MMKHAEQKKMKIGQRLASFIQRHRLFILILGAVVVLTPILVFVVDAISQRVLADATDLAFKAEKKLNEYQEAKKAKVDEAKLASLENEAMGLLEDLINRYVNYYGGLKALRNRADLNLAKLKEGVADKGNELFLQALADLLTIVNRAPHSILASTALMDAATLVLNLPIMKENASTTNFTVTPAEVYKTIEERLKIPADIASTLQSSYQDQAMYLYQYLVNNFPKSVHVPEALINLAALYEAKGAYKEAGEIYGRLESDFSNNAWTKLAQNQMLRLITEGHLAE